MLPPRPLSTGEAQALRRRVVAHLDIVKSGESVPSLGAEDIATLLNILDWFTTSTTPTPTPIPTPAHQRSSNGAPEVQPPSPTLQAILETVLRTERKIDTTIKAPVATQQRPTEAPPARRTWPPAKHHHASQLSESSRPS